MSQSAAATIHHDVEKVRSSGISVVEDPEADILIKNSKYEHVTIGDLEPERLEAIVRSMAVPYSFDVIAVCAQDHGTPPAGLSHLDYRHNLFRQQLDISPFPHTMLYKSDEVPATFNRLSSIAREASSLPADEIYLMDSGMAAILGATMDPSARSKTSLLVTDIATSHTVGAAMKGEEIAGFFEYHTHDITLDRLESLLGQLADGTLEHSRLLKEGGHGAYVRKALGFSSVETIIATGPKRKLVENSRLPFVMGAPLGDNMMTGTVGLLEAIRRRGNDFKPISYL